ncbi:MAG: hypothetical protein ACP5MM_04595 [Acidithiobacillus sp.]|uniref:hypothetical protein n=1 Tax=Acidithiobacillus sp. TaxID=1872118 RepID=UPI003CFC69CF
MKQVKWGMFPDRRGFQGRRWPGGRDGMECNAPLRVSEDISARDLLDQCFRSDLQAVLDAHPDLPASAGIISLPGPWRRLHF